VKKRGWLLSVWKLPYSPSSPHFQLPLHVLTCDMRRTVEGGGGEELHVGDEVLDEDELGGEGLGEGGARQEGVTGDELQGVNLSEEELTREQGGRRPRAYCTAMAMVLPPCRRPR
jgi:hypothetical protein